MTEQIARRGEWPFYGINRNKAYVLMTAMPPTTGHLELIQFADALAGYGYVHVIINTQPQEPFPFERAEALQAAILRCDFGQGVTFHHMHETLEQDPSAPGFWPMWRDIMNRHGFREGDMIVASETYGKRLAEECGGRFFPYDIDREINPVKATLVRDDPFANFNKILPEFQKHLRTTVTIFGAESCGKTTLSKDLGKIYGKRVPEWARCFLENTSDKINVQSMTDIWMGQTALQRQVSNFHGYPCVVQDTDLFSTIGYWNLNQHGLGHLPTWSGLGAAPEGLIVDAIDFKSDLYIFTQSNIPFEEDPLRYGGDHREGSDEYWLQVCKDYGLNYVVLEASDRGERVIESMRAIESVMKAKFDLLAYDRGGF